MLKMHLTAVSAFALLCACSNTKTYSTKDGSVSVESKGNDATAVHITGKDGASVDFNSGKPITGYPSDAPLYEGKPVMDLKSEKDHARSVTVQTSDSMDKISDFYKSQLASKGWKVETTMSSAQMTMYAATKDQRKLVVSIGSDGKTQTVSQQLSDH